MTRAKMDARVLAITMLVLSTGCAHKPNASLPVVSPNAYRAYTSACRDLIAQPPNAESAITTLEPLTRQDADNAMNHYALACCYAKQGDWDRVQQSLDSGNASKRCVHYVWEGPLRPLPMYMRFRQLAQDCKQAGDTIGSDKAVGLYESIRDMGARILRSAEPRATLSVAMGINLRSHGNLYAAAVYRSVGRSTEADRAEQAANADNSWMKSVSGQLQELDSQLVPLTLRTLTREEAIAYLDGKEPEPRDIQKLEALDREAGSTIGLVIDQLVRTAPP